ncbi:MAG: 3-hydroxyacyl-CoA dehydrogenase [Rhizobiaceae bacterium]|nr:3-hydroxyacyl-CoA dehydrogenase [Rhizobiaceae bacterium]
MDMPPDAFHNVAVIGAGSIGVAWSIVFARSGISVALYDANPERLPVAMDEMRQRLAELREFSLIDEAEDTIAGRVRPVSGLADALDGADYVQEAAPENLDLKKALFGELDRLSRQDAVLASSSSAITASAFADHLPGRARCLVVHPGNPPYLLKIAEIVPAPFTAKDVVDRVTDFLAAVGMVPVLIRKEVEGFVFNRLQGAILREAYCLVRDGVISVDDLDRVMHEGPGPRWAFIGPFETSDLNTRGGIEVHAGRMGSVYARLGAERGQNDPWTEDLVAKVTAERRAILPLDQWNERTGWRDRRLMALARLKRQMDGEPGENRTSPDKRKGPVD